jgi:hypothetical protein
LLNKNILIIKTPIVADFELTDDIIAFIQSWSVMVDWNKYKAIVFVDLENIFFLLFNLKDEELSDCYMAKLVDDLWYMEPNKAKTWERINNIISILQIEDEMTLGGFFNGLQGI